MTRIVLFMNHVVLVILGAAVLPEGRGTSEPRRLAIEFLYLDTTECTRCIDTGTRLDQALALLRPVLAETGWEAHLTKTHVTSEEQGRTLRFASSPTVRINGQDIQLESRESVCGDCGKLCKDAAVTCREWRYRDQWFTSPPKGLFVDAILSAMHAANSTTPQREAARATAPFEVPENLKRFFATKKAASSRTACCAGDRDEGEKTGCCESRISAKNAGCCESGGAADDTPKGSPANSPGCTLNAESRATRRKDLAELMRGVVERKPVDHGISLRFNPEPGLVARLAQAVDLERDCCQFLTFKILVEEKNGPVWLELTGSADTKKLIDEYFGEQPK